MTDEKLIEVAFKAHEDAPTWQDDPVARDAAIRWHMRGFNDARAVFKKAHAPNVSNRLETDILPDQMSVNAPTNDEREEALHLIEQAESFREQTSPDVDAFPNSMVGLWLRTASALEAALRRSEVPEPQGEPTDAQVEDAWWIAQEAGDLPRVPGPSNRDAFEVGYRAALRAAGEVKR